MFKRISNAPIHYERVNFLNEFEVSNGYVMKVLCIYEESNFEDGVYYNNREIADIPCVDKEIFIVSNYNDNFNTYILLQIDFSMPSNYKILMSLSIEKEMARKKVNSKKVLLEYLRDENLVEILSGKPKKKAPQIEPLWGSLLIEIIERLQKLCHSEVSYQYDKMEQLILDNAPYSDIYKNYESQFESNHTATIRLRNRITHSLGRVFIFSEKDLLTYKEMLEIIDKCQENYHYNL